MVKANIAPIPAIFQIEMGKLFPALNEITYNQMISKYIAGNKADASLSLLDIFIIQLYGQRVL